MQENARRSRSNPISEQDWIQAVHQWLCRTSASNSDRELGDLISGAGLEDLEQLVQVVSSQLMQFDVSTARLQILMQAVAARVIDQLKPHQHLETAMINPELLGQLYERLTEIDGQAAAHSLQLLAAQRDEESIDRLTECLAETPPGSWRDAGLGLSPLWEASSEQLEFFFDRLELEIFHPSIMAVLLDLANYATRNKKLQIHPWHERVSALATLLSQVVIRLEQLQKEPSKFGEQVAQVQRVLGESVALTVALCDALGLIGDQLAIDALKQASDLSHRRIQAEAAAALARLGYDHGRERLIALAADPVARLRAVNYAEELGLSERIDEAQRTPVALAESELASWLAAPEQFGIPPTELTHVDSRMQYWPGYVEPCDCHLFRFEYRFPGGTFVNIGIAGPCTYSFQSDLTRLPIDDVYAAFAGWQAEHEEIFEIPLPLLNASQRREADCLEQHFMEQGWRIREGIALTFMLGEIALVARLENDDGQVCGITDGLETFWFPDTQASTAATPEVVLSIYRGRKLLRTFNS
jgi:hypothetical protein